MAQQKREISDEETDKIADAIIATFPPGLTDEEFERRFYPLLEQAVAEREYGRAPVEGSGSSRFLSNLGQAINPVPMVQGLYQMGRHPLQTGQAILGQQLEQFQKGRERLQGTQPGFQLSEVPQTLQALGHFAAGALPLVGPMAANIGEQLESGDVAGAAGAFTGTVGPSLVVPGAQQLRRVAPGVDRAASYLERQAAERFAQVMRPELGGKSKYRFGVMADKVSGQLSQMPGMAAWSREGLLRNITPRLHQAEAAIDAANDARLSALTFETQPLIDALRKKRQEFVAEAVQGTQIGYQPITVGGKRATTFISNQGPIGTDVLPAPSRLRVSQIDEAIRELEQLGPYTRYEPIRRIRASFDGVAKREYSKIMGDYFEKTAEQAGAADVTGTLREWLATKDPATAAANVDYTLYKRASDVIKMTDEIEKQRPTVAKTILQRAVGAAGGGAVSGTTLGAVVGSIVVPSMMAVLDGGRTTKLKFARLQTQLADFLRTGNTNGVVGVLHQISRLAPAVGAMQRYRNQQQPAENQGQSSDLFLNIQSDPQAR